MALIRPNNRALQNITTLPTGITEYNLTAGDLPSGSVIKYAQYDFTGDDGTGHSSIVYTDSATGTPVTFTPTFSNSILVHNFWCNAYFNNNTGTSSGLDHRFLRDNTEINFGINGTLALREDWLFYMNTASYANDTYPGIFRTWSETANTTSQITWKLQGRKYQGNNSGATWYSFTPHNGKNSSSERFTGHWSIMEIAG